MCLGFENRWRRDQHSYELPMDITTYRMTDQPDSASAAVQHLFFDGNNQNTSPGKIVGDQFVDRKMSFSPNEMSFRLFVVVEFFNTPDPAFLPTKRQSGVPCWPVQSDKLYRPLFEVKK